MIDEMGTRYAGLGKGGETIIATRRLVFGCLIVFNLEFIAGVLFFVLVGSGISFSIAVEFVSFSPSPVFVSRFLFRRVHS